MQHSNNSKHHCTPVSYPNLLLCNKKILTSYAWRCIKCPTCVSSLPLKKERETIELGLLISYQDAVPRSGGLYLTLTGQKRTSGLQGISTAVIIFSLLGRFVLTLCYGNLTPSMPCYAEMETT